ncbi:MAG: ATP phosphoribosyltransferase _ HisGl, partial [uncultured Acidimicrobiales bacterium]
AQAGPAQGLSREVHPCPVRRRRSGRAARLRRRLQGHRRRSADRRRPHPASPGDRPLRGRGALRHRDHRPRLDRGDGERGRLPRRAALLQGHRPPGEHRAGRRGGRPGPLGGRPPRRCPGGHRVPGADPPVPGEARPGRRHPPVVRGHRGQGPGDRRRGGRADRDRTGATSGGPSGDRHDPRQPHRADRQPGGVRGSRQAPRHGPDSHPPARHSGGARPGPGEAERERRRPRRGHRVPALPALTYRLEALRRRCLRGGDRRAEGPDQHPDPGPQGPRRHRHHRAADLQDRPL